MKQPYTYKRLAFAKLLDMVGTKPKPTWIQANMLELNDYCLLHPYLQLSHMCLRGWQSKGNTSFLLMKQAILVNHHAQQVHMTNILHGSAVVPLSNLQTRLTQKASMPIVTCDVLPQPPTLNALSLKYRTWVHLIKPQVERGLDGIRMRDFKFTVDTITYKLLFTFF